MFKPCFYYPTVAVLPPLHVSDLAYPSRNEELGITVPLPLHRFGSFREGILIPMVASQAAWYRMENGAATRKREKIGRTIAP